MTTAFPCHTPVKMADNDEWTTVTSKKRGDDVYKPKVSALPPQESKPAASGTYIPPSQRAAAAAGMAAVEAKKPLNLASETLFPSLGGKVAAAPAAANSWASRVNFKQKVEQLIVKDKETVEEKVAAEEERKAMDGWERLYIPKLTSDYIFAFNTYIGARDREADRIANLIELGLYTEPVTPPPRKLSPLRNPAVFKPSEFEDYESPDEFEQEERLSDVD